jgi:NitT/TauT family transport system substrate-binding protein
MTIVAKVRTALVLIGSVIMLASLAGTPVEADPIRVAHDNTSHAAPFYVAEKEGFYKDEGIQVDRRVTQARGLIDALIGGTVDLISTRGDRVGVIAGRGIDVVALAIVRDGNQNMMLVPIQNKTAKSVKDLVGKKIGAQQGTGTWFTWVEYLSRIGLSPKDFTVRNMKTDSLPAALAANELDGALTWEPFGSLIIDKGLGRMVMGPKDYEDVLGYTSPVFLTTMAKYLKQNPDGVLRFLKAYVRSMKFIDTHHDETAKLMSKFWQGEGLDFTPEKASESLYRLFRWNRVMISQQDIKEVQDAVDKSAKSGTLPKRIDVAAHVNTDLVQKAEAALKSH